MSDKETKEQATENKKYKMKCCISSCRSESPPHFPFPKEPNLKKIWESVTGKTNVKSYSTKVCKKHFQQEDFLRDLKSELLGLPIKHRLKQGAVPKYHLPIDEDEVASKESEEQPRIPVGSNVSSRGRIIKRKNKDGQEESSNPIIGTWVPVKEKKKTNEKTKVDAKKVQEEDEAHHDYNLPRSIPSIQKRIETLKNELNQLRKARDHEVLQPSPAVVTENPIFDLTESIENDTEVSAEDIRLKYRAAVGFKTGVKGLENSPQSVLKKPSGAQISSDKLFYVALNSLALQGSPQVTAEYFVNQIIDQPLKALQRSKSEVMEYLGQSVTGKDTVMVFDKEAFHLWSVNKEATKETLAPLEKLTSLTGNEVSVTRSVH